MSPYHYFFMYFLFINGAWFSQTNLFLTGTSFWSMLSRLVLNVPREPQLGTFNSCIKSNLVSAHLFAKGRGWHEIFIGKIFVFCYIEWFSAFVCYYRTPSWPLDSVLKIRLLKPFFSICIYQVTASLVYKIFETGLIFENIFVTVDLIESFLGWWHHLVLH